MIKKQGKKWIVGNGKINVSCSDMSEVENALTWLEQNEATFEAPAPTRKEVRRAIVLELTKKKPLLVQDIVAKVGGDYKRFSATCLALYRAKKLKRMQVNDNFAYVSK